MELGLPVERGHDRLDDRLGLPAAARVAAALSSEIIAAEPDPLTMAELDDRLHRYATVLLATPHDTLARAALADWRRVQAALGRRLSPASHRELTRLSGFLSFTLGLLAVDSGDETSARRFAALAGLLAAQLDDDLLTGTVATLDGVIALSGGRHEAALCAAARALATRHPYLFGWAVALEASAAAALGDIRRTETALGRLAAERPGVCGLRHPGWPPFDEVREACVVAYAMSRIGAAGADDLARAALDVTVVGTLEQGWSLAALAGAVVHHDPAEAGRHLAPVVEILDRLPSWLLAVRVAEIVRMAGTPSRLAHRPTGDHGTLFGFEAAADPKSVP